MWTPDGIVYVNPNTPIVVSGNHAETEFDSDLDDLVVPLKFRLSKPERESMKVEVIK